MQGPGKVYLVTAGRPTTEAEGQAALEVSGAVPGGSWAVTRLSEATVLKVVVTPVCASEETTAAVQPVLAAPPR